MNRGIHFVTLKEISILGGNSSKVEISPCSSEEFFQHFPKRTTFSLAEAGSYKPILKSPLQDLREANKDCPLYLDKEGERVENFFLSKLLCPLQLSGRFVSTGAAGRWL